MDGEQPGPFGATNVSLLRPSRGVVADNSPLALNSTAPASYPTTPVDEADEPLCHLARELAREVGADAILVAWRDASAPPACLFADGDWQEEEIEAALLDAAAPLSPGQVELKWHACAGSPAGRLAIGFAAKGGSISIAALFRRLSDSGRTRAAATAQRLVPMIRPFFRLWTLGHHARRIESSLASALDHSDVATVLVDERGEPMFVNAAAQRLISNGEGLRRTGSHLAGERLSDTLRLQSAIEHALGEESPGWSTPVVALKRAGRRALLAAVVAYRPRGSETAPPRAVIHVFDPERDLHDIAEPVCKHYGLSPVETRLAGLLVEGASLTEAAQRMRVREQTARTYLKQMFLKTETNRQAEFVLLMLKSSIRLVSRSRPSFF